MKETYEYLTFLGKTAHIIRMGIDWFHYRDNEFDLPKVGAFCKHCAKETAKPVFPIYMNGKEAYALKCDKCGSEYPMYKSMFITRYIGYDTISGGHVNPTHGTKSVVASMDRKARDHYNDRGKRVEDQMCKIMKCSPEEYREQKKEWDKEHKIWQNKFEREEAARDAKYKDEIRKEESNKRKELIEKGIIKYVKNIGLLNTETGEIIKL